MPTALSYKAVGFELQELKARDDGWSFSGYASTFGNIDEGGDVVFRGAFTDSLRRRPSPRLLWQHDIAEPLGKVLHLREDDRGLFGEFKISKTARGHDAYQLLKDGAIDSMSIGYVPEDQDFSHDGIRQLKAVDLLEISVVSIPMNAEAVITAVKARTAVSEGALTVATLDMPESVDPDRGPSILTLKLALARKQLVRRGLLESA